MQFWTAIDTLQIVVQEILYNLRPSTFRSTNTKNVKSIRRNRIMSGRHMNSPSNNNGAFFTKTSRYLDGPRQGVNRNRYSNNVRRIIIMDLLNIFIFQLYPVLFSDQIHNREQAQRRCHVQLYVRIHWTTVHFGLNQFDK